jgi:hypothetical protein
LTQKEKRADYVYMQFDEEDIGYSNRNKVLSRKNALIDKAHESWTVIQAREVTILKPAKYLFVIKRRQLPIVECESMTIHKSQGQTYEKCAVDISRVLAPSLLYVALSRVTTLEGLFLFGRSSIYEKWTNERLEIERKSRENSAFQVEMRRMRKECLMENLFPFLSESYPKPHMSFIFVNIQHLTHNKLKAIQSDIGFHKCDIFFLSECHLNQNTNLLERIGDDYIIASATKSMKEFGSHGQVT